MIGFALLLDGGVSKSADRGTQTHDRVIPNPDRSRQGAFQGLTLGIESLLSRGWDRGVTQIRKNGPESLQDIPGAQPALP
jgi:hypothetical protein